MVHIIYEWVMTHGPAASMSHGIYGWVVIHIGMIHRAYYIWMSKDTWSCCLDESWLVYEGVEAHIGMSHIWMSRDTYRNDSWHIYELSCVARSNEHWHIYEYVVARIEMRRCKYM